MPPGKLTADGVDNLPGLVIDVVAVKPGEKALLK
jgi:hypothetical protein